VERRLSVLLAFVALGVVLAAPASSGDGIKMRHVRGACIPTCFGDRAPVWSPDGRTIAFIRRTARVSPRAVFTVPARGGAARRVSPPDQGVIPNAITWAPDSTRLVVEAGGVNYVVPARGGKPVKVVPASTTGPVFSDKVARWSLDGTRLAIERYGPSPRYGPPPWCCQIVLSAPDGSSSTVLGGGPPPADWLTEPAWSPDGRIAYVTGPRTSGGHPDVTRAEIWVSRPDGSGRRQLVGDSSDHGFDQLTWSRDGSKLAYVAHTRDLYELRAVGSDGQHLGIFGAIMRKPTSNHCCEIAPDARKAVFAEVGADGAMEVRLVSSFRTQRISDGVSRQSWPRLTAMSWPPDGERVAYVSDGDCPTELGVYTVRLTNRRKGTDHRRLTRSCRILGTHGSNRLHGTARTEAFYGRGGNDRLYAFGGPDFLQGGLGRDILFAGLGDDRLYGGPGGDRLNGGPGWDALYSRDRVRDVVVCGSGRDAVRADREDVIARDCELVERE
jgi:Tol biopolymer transport system component